MDEEALQILTVVFTAATSVGVASLWIGLGTRLGRVENELRALVEKESVCKEDRIKEADDHETRLRTLEQVKP